MARRRARRSARWATLAVASAALVVAAGCAVDLGTLGGASFSEAHAVNEAGTVAGAALTAEGRTHAFRLAPGGSMVDLGLPAGSPAATSAEANAINAGGTVVGDARAYDDVLRVTVSHALRWDPGVADPVELGSLGGPAGAEAHDINDAGLVVGSSAVPGGFNVWDRAWLFDPAVGHPVALPAEPGWIYSIAYAINSSGAIVGTSSTDGETWRAVRWEAGTHAVTDLSNGLPFGELSVAHDINDAGAAVGEFRWQGHAVRWPAGATVPEDLGTLAGQRSSSARSISDSGVIVGEADAPQGTAVVTHAFRWDPADAVMVDLGTLDGGQAAALAVADGVAPVGWSTTAAGSRHASRFDPDPLG